MPFLSKRVISQFIRRDCHRQLRLLLSPDNQDYRHEREAAGMPDPHNPRPGLELVAQAGRDWELEKIRELQQTFGGSCSSPRSSSTRTGSNASAKSP